MLSQPRLPLPDFYQGRVLNFAHRGARMEAPENTIPAFERAAVLGADGVELDVQLSADGVPVVFHDFELAKTVDGSSLLREQPFKALRMLDVGKSFSAAFAGTQMPTLDEVFQAVGQRLLINVELKYFGTEQRVIDDLVEAVVACVRKHAMSRRVLFSSFNPRSLRLCQKHAPEIPIGLLYDAKLTSPVWWSRIVAGRHQAEHPEYGMVSERYLRWARRRGYRVNVWTVNQPADIHRMLDLGVDMIMSDFPNRVRDALRARNSPDG